MKRWMIAFFILMLFSSLVFAQDRGGGFSWSDGAPVDWYSKSIAFVVGIDSYSQGWPRLSQAVKDAQRMEAALKARGFTVFTLYDKNAMGSEIVAGLRKAASQTGKNDAFVFYYAGHGHTQKSARDGSEAGYLAPVDAKSGDLTGYISVSQIRDEINSTCAAKHVLLVLDSCFSGTLLTRAQLTEGGVADYLSKSGIYGITAGMQDQPAVDGLFTSVLIEGLDGNADYNNDGYVTFKELGLYAEQNVRVKNRYQTPDYGVMYGAGQFVFKRPGGAVPRQSEKVKLDFGKGASVGTVYEAPDVSDYKKLAEEAKAAEQNRQAAEEARRVYFSRLEEAWSSVSDIAGTTAVDKDKRIAVVRKFLSEFPQDNPRKVEAEGLIRQIENERAPEPVTVAKVKHADSGEVWSDSTSGLMWQKTPPENTMKREAAKSYCSDLTLGGYSDWRLPSISELRSLIRGCPATENGGVCKITDDCLSEDSCWSTACQGCSINGGPGAGGQYWPSELPISDKWGFRSSSPNESDGVWGVSFNYGDLVYYSVNFDTYVRCVR